MAFHESLLIHKALPALPGHYGKSYFMVFFQRDLVNFRENWSLFVLLLISLLNLVTCAPYGGWGPNEGFGHTGSNPPPKNINAIYGYDYHDLFDDFTTYGAVHNPHKTR